MRVVQLRLGPGSCLGHFSIIRNLQRLDLGENATIGTFNWVFGMAGHHELYFASEKDRLSELTMAAESALTSRHIVDCTNRVVIGAYTTIAGFRSQILTHGINIEKNKQSSEPVVIGKYCLIGSGSMILKGAVVPDYSIIGAGSVFRGQPNKPYQMYAGVPARPIKTLSRDTGYFRRDFGPVS